jgi:BirA family transcriptional regulator, biotin operon repressor / biotin---[acetyl-CoA-carboxylase] ligase
VTDWLIHRVGTTGSTNDDLLAMAEAGAESRTVVVADHQLSGRGRLDRQWVDQPNAALLASLLIRTPTPHAVARQVAVAAARSCERFAPLEVRVKWPNDLVVDDVKLAGMLSQVGVSGRHTQFVVVGIGVNLRWAPPGATRLGDVDRDLLLEALLTELDIVAATPDAGESQYRGRSATVGRMVRVELFNETVVGRALAIDPDGHLVVETTTGVRVISTGDVVHLRDHR